MRNVPSFSAKVLSCTLFAWACNPPLKCRDFYTFDGSISQFWNVYRYFMLVEICSWCPRVINDFLSLFNFLFITFSWLALLLEKTRPLIPFHSFMFYFISPHQIWKTKVTKLWFPAHLLYWYFFLIYIGSWEECSPTRTFAIWCCFGIALAKFFSFKGILFCF